MTHGLDGRLTVWDLTTGARLKDWALPEVVDGLALAPDGRHLAVGLGTGVVYVLRLAEPPAVKDEETVPYNSKTHGNLRVKGDTGDWFQVQRGGKNAGPPTPPRLNSAVELPPGKYDVLVNRTKRTVTIQVGKETVLQTGTLVVEGKGASWYAPYEGKERRVATNPPALNSPVALFPGTYSVVVRVGQQDRKLADDVRVTAGQKTVLKK